MSSKKTMTKKCLRCGRPVRGAPDPDDGQVWVWQCTCEGFWILTDGEGHYHYAEKSLGGDEAA